MKKSMLNVITLALVLINLVLTVLLTFSLVSTNTKTNNLITKVAQIVDLDVGGVVADTTTATASVDDTVYLDVTSNDSKDITVSYTDAGSKTHYVVLNVSIGLNSKHKDYEAKQTSINNGMRMIVSQIITEALKYPYTDVATNKTTIEKNLLTYLQDQFQSDVIQTVTLTKTLVQ